jgi:hypothetical protein
MASIVVDRLDRAANMGRSGMPAIAERFAQGKVERRSVYGCLGVQRRDAASAAECKRHVARSCPAPSGAPRA